MKVFLLLGLIVLSIGLKTQADATVLATTSISLQDLLSQIQLISNELMDESFVEAPTIPSNNDDDPSTIPDDENTNTNQV